jgi:hypothetical protein
MRNRRSVAGNQNLRREIFNIRRARQAFINCFALLAAFWIPSAASRIFGRKAKSAGTIDLPSAEQMPFLP